MAAIKSVRPGVYGPGVNNGPQHHYMFELYALDKLDAQPSADALKRANVMKAIRGIFSARRSTADCSSGLSRNEVREVSSLRAPTTTCTRASLAGAPAISVTHRRPGKAAAGGAPPTFGKATVPGRIAATP